MRLSLIGLIDFNRKKQRFVWHCCRHQEDVLSGLIQILLSEFRKVFNVLRLGLQSSWSHRAIFLFFCDGWSKMVGYNGRISNQFYRLIKLELWTHCSLDYTYIITTLVHNKSVIFSIWTFEHPMICSIYKIKIIINSKK